MKNVRISTRRSNANSSEQPEKEGILIKGENKLTQFVPANTFLFFFLPFSLVPCY